MKALDMRKMLQAAILCTVALMFAAPSIAQTPTGNVVSVMWSPDGTLIVGGGSVGLLGIWDASTGQIITTLPANTQGVASVDWSPDSQRFASSRTDGSISIWSRSGALLNTFAAHENIITSLAWSPDGIKLASATFDGEETIKIWDAVNYQSQPLTQQSGLGVHSIRWHPNSQAIAVASIGGVFVFDIDQMPVSSSPNFLTHQLGLTKTMFSVAWSPDGEKLAGGDTDGDIHIWDVNTETELLTLTGHTQLVDALAWSPDGIRLASASSEDDTIRVWDTGNGALLNTYVYTNPVFTTSIDWHPDPLENRLVYGSANEQINIVQPDRVTS